MDDQRLVVGAALVRDGRVLAARRTAPPETAGRWELPGGKVEPGEGPDDAVRREVTEELGCRVVVAGWLPERVAVRADLALVVAVVRLVHGEPRATEHDAVRWLGPDELDEVDWLDADRPFLPGIALLLRAGPHGGGVRAVLDDEDDARSLAGDLVAAGFSADLERAPLAGEDDDEDQPWAVRTDAPQALLHTLLDPREGWVDPGPLSRSPPAAPLDLPRAPRRHHRPQGPPH